MRFSSRALWFALWLTSLPGVAVAFVLLIPEWMARLAKLLCWPAGWAWGHFRGPQTKAERIAELQSQGFEKRTGAWVMGRKNRRAAAKAGKVIS
jgi:hypothetical protein